MRLQIDIRVEPPRISLHRRRRSVVAAIAVLMALLLPSVALANHLFSDVPTTHTFHTNISNLANAGITAGCTPTTYCPDSFVTRAQMAGFLNRGLGRVATSNFQDGAAGTAETTVASATITPGTSPGALPGAQQYIRAVFTGSVYMTNVDSCPCMIGIYLRGSGGPGEEFQSLITAGTISATGVYLPITTGGIHAFTGSAPITVELRARINAGGTTTSAYTLFGNITLETFPFGGTGGPLLAIPGQQPVLDPSLRAGSGD